MPSSQEDLILHQEILHPIKPFYPFLENSGSHRIFIYLFILTSLHAFSEEIEEENRIPQPPPITHPRTSPQPESGIKRLFSFFSRDKKRLANTQRPTHIHESFGQWAITQRDDGYTEQGQEALQHL